MESFVDIFRVYFPQPVRAAGSSLLMDGHVDELTISSDEVSAQIYGTRLYEPKLKWSNANQSYEFISICDCTQGARGELCKHLWAMVMKIEEEKIDRRLWPDLTECSIIIVAEAAAGRVVDVGLNTAIPSSDNRSWNEFIRRTKEPLYEDSFKSSAPESKIQFSLCVDFVNADDSPSTYFDILYQKQTPKQKKWGKLSSAGSQFTKLLEAPFDATDHRFHAELLKFSKAIVRPLSTLDKYASYASSVQTSFAVHVGTQIELLRAASSVGRLYARKMTDRFISRYNSPQLIGPIEFTENQAVPVIRWVKTTPQEWSISFCLNLDGQIIDSVHIDALSASLVLAHRRLCHTIFSSRAQQQLAAQLCQQRVLRIPASSVGQFVDELQRSGLYDAINVPDELRWKPASHASIKAILTFRAERMRGSRRFTVSADVLYGELKFSLFDLKHHPVLDFKNRVCFSRDWEREAELRQELIKAGLDDSQESMVTVEAIAGIATELDLQPHWSLFIENKRLYQNKAPDIKVSSGIDWFDVDVSYEFNDHLKSELPPLLAAIRDDWPLVPLGKDAMCLLPQQWIKRYGRMIASGSVRDESLRFSKSQAILLDAMLAEHDRVQIDSNFAKQRQEWGEINGVPPALPSPRFTGKLRPYQCEGLGWLLFLRKFGLGGCLADDMGLGKTVQVLALLDRIYGEAPLKPSLVVVPVSLMNNWIREAAQFTPELKVSSYYGSERDITQFQSSQIILTTYGTLRSEIEALSAIDFHYVILDESQNIKNSSALAHKAARVLRAEHRLAMSGTPVENHLGELWALFAFLNPGLIDRSLIKDLDSKSESVALLAKSIRPLILRRTKAEVLSDLPEKSEAVIYCDLDQKDLEQYNAIKRQVSSKLNDAIDEQGLARSKMMVLEGLLRLRQSACHPGLIDHKLRGATSAKLQILLNQLEEVISSGHKALVFSQFTSLLAIVKAKLDEKSIPYVYLDGTTKDRMNVVDEFQNNAEMPVFLLSLKAGGVGLNLTAADYCFLLDPWWNPAVESQAIDRCHRMGQTRPVFAYRLIARQTIEEKIIELQHRKRDLANALIAGSAGFLKKMTREDLNFLLT